MYTRWDAEFVIGGFAIRVQFLNRPIWWHEPWGLNIWLFVPHGSSFLSWRKLINVCTKLGALQQSLFFRVREIYCTKIRVRFSGLEKYIAQKFRVQFDRMICWLMANTERTHFSKQSIVVGAYHSIMSRASKELATCIFQIFWLCI